MSENTPEAAFVPDETINPAPETVTPVKAKKAKAPKVPKEPKPVKVPKVKLEHAKKNGVVRPSEGTKTGRIWSICEEIGNKTNAAPKRGAVIEQAVAENLGAGTASTQFGRFCKYWGISNPRPTAFQKGENKHEKAPAPEGGAAKAPAAHGNLSGKKGLTAAAGAEALSAVEIETPSEDPVA